MTHAWVGRGPHSWVPIEEDDLGGEEVEVCAFDTELRTEALQMAVEMHRLYKDGASIPPRYAACCRSCSLLDLCMPQINQGERASDYLSRYHLLD